MGALKQNQIDIPYYCRPCGEMLSNGQIVCPFCDRQAVSIDDELEARFAARNQAFNNHIDRIMREEGWL